MIILLATALIAAPVITHTQGSQVVMDANGAFYNNTSGRGLHCVSFPSQKHSASHQVEGIIPVGSDTSRKCWVSSIWRHDN